jgi:hypothetical protein
MTENNVLDFSMNAAIEAVAKPVSEGVSIETKESIRERIVKKELTLLEWVSLSISVLRAHSLLESDARSLGYEVDVAKDGIKVHIDHKRARV